MSLALLVQVFAWSFPSTHRVIFSEEFLINFSSWFSLVRSSLRLLMLVLVRSFSNTAHVGFSEEFLLLSWC